MYKKRISFSFCLFFQQIPNHLMCVRTNKMSYYRVCFKFQWTSQISVVGHYWNYLSVGMLGHQTLNIWTKKELCAIVDKNKNKNLLMSRFVSEHHFQWYIVCFSSLTVNYLLHWTPNQPYGRTKQMHITQNNSVEESTEAFEQTSD